MKSLQTCLSVVILVGLSLNLAACNRNDEMFQLAEMAQRGDRSYKQYRTGDYGTARAALLDYIRYLESKLGDRSFVHIETAKLDIMNSYTRLAKLEEKNNGPEKEAFMQKAIAICMQVIKDKKCSAADLRAFTDGMDRVEPK